MDAGDVLQAGAGIVDDDGSVGGVEEEEMLFTRFQQNDPSLDRLYLCEDMLNYIVADTERRAAFKEAARLNVFVKEVSLHVPWTEGRSFRGRCRDIAQGLGSLPSLDILEFWTVRVDSYLALPFFLREIRQIGELLVVVRHSFRPDAIAVANIDQAILGHPELERLYFRFLYFHPSADETELIQPVYTIPFHTSLGTLPKLKTIFIKGAKNTIVDPRQMGEIKIASLQPIFHATRVWGISLHGLRISQTINQEIADYMQRNSSSLVYFAMDEYCVVPPLDSEEMAMQVRQHPNLKYVSLACSNNTQFYQHWGRMKELKILKLHAASDTQLHSRGLSSVLSAFGVGSILTKLFLHDYDWDLHLIGLLGGCMGGTRTIRHLTIETSKYGRLDDDTWMDLAPAVARNSALASLAIAGELTPQGFCGPFSTCFSLHKILEDLVVGSGSVIQRGRGLWELAQLALFLITTLTTMRSNIQCLKFHNAEVPSREDYFANGEEIREIIYQLKRNFWLCACPLPRCCDPYASTQEKHQYTEVQIVLKLNKAGRKYLVENRWSKERAVGVLVQISDDLEAIYFHVREHPEMCLRKKSWRDMFSGFSSQFMGGARPKKKRRRRSDRLRVKAP